MSQVKNLRAMFEQGGKSSPPDRGRTQALPPPGSDSPRPLSRVRTSFITVEKDGRVGLQRDPSTDSVLSQTRKVSGGSEGDTVFSQTDATSTSAGERFETPSKPGIAAWQTPVRRAASATDGPERILLTPPSPKAAPASPAPVSIPVPALAPALALKPSRATSSVPVPGAVPALEPTHPTSLAPAPAPVSAPSPVEASVPTAPPAVNTNDEAKRNVLEKAPVIGIAADAPPDKLPSKATADKSESGTPSGPISTAKKVAPTADEETRILAAKTIPEPAQKPVAKTPAVSAPAIATHVASKLKTANGNDHKEVRKAATPSMVTTTTSAKAKADKKPLKAISSTAANSKPGTKAAGAAIKTPTSPPKHLSARHPTRTPEKKTPAAAEKPTMGTPKSTASSAGKSTASSSAKKPPPIQSFPPNGIGFVKPKPKSPTRPVHLPAGLTTHTASSATRVNVPRQSLSRTSGHFGLTHHPVARPLSRSSMIAGAGVATPARLGLKRQNSTISRPRPSIGPPPKQPAQDHPILRKEKEIDEGFLARMMRPTQASASKTADKIHLSPPRKHSEPATKRPVRNVQGTTAKKHPASHLVKKASSTTPSPAASLVSHAALCTPEPNGSEATPSETAPSVVEVTSAGAISETAPSVHGPADGESTASLDGISEQLHAISLGPSVAHDATESAQGATVAQEVEQPRVDLEPEISPSTATLVDDDLSPKEPEVKNMDASTTILAEPTKTELESVQVESI